MPSRKWVVVLAVLGAGACRSAGPKTRPAQPGAAGLVESYVGQRRILIHKGDQKRVEVERGNLMRITGDCDVAVEVREAALEKGILRFRLERLGRIAVEGAKGKARTACDKIQPEVALAVSGFEGALTREGLEADLARILPSTDIYLSTRGYVLPSAKDDPQAMVASNQPGADGAARTLWRQITVQPRQALRIDPDYRDPAGKVQHEGEVEFAAVVGADGRLRDVKVKTSLSEEHQAHVLRTLQAWRYEPALTKDGPVPARIDGRLVFRIYE